jgi:hypothetical protein
MKLSSFAETLIVLLISAALIPLVFRFIDDRKTARQRMEDEHRQQRQMVFEADLSRQSKVIEAQVQFLERLAELLWEYQLTAIAVSYYHQFNLEDQYQAAAKQYLAVAGTLLGKVRGEISKSLRLCSKQTYENLRGLYYDHLLKLDTDLTVLIADPDRQHIGGPSWKILNKEAVYTLSQKVDNIFHDLAAEFRLTGQSASASENATPPTLSQM